MCVEYCRVCEYINLKFVLLWASEIQFLNVWNVISKIKFGQILAILCQLAEVIAL